MTRLLHISDTHGTFPHLQGDFDLIVHSGDFFPNATRGNRLTEPGWQEGWLQNQAEALVNWARGVPLVYCPGNHDFAAHALGLYGADVLEPYKPVEVDGVSFVGFPFINWICDEWNYEMRPGEMVDACKRLGDVLRSRPEPVDVLVCHTGIYGTLDGSCGDHYGSAPLGRMLMDLPPKRRPKVLLHGHFHESNGVAMFGGILVSNAATTQRVVEI